MTDAKIPNIVDDEYPRPFTLQMNHCATFYKKKIILVLFILFLFHLFYHWNYQKIEINFFKLNKKNYLPTTPKPSDIFKKSFHKKKI